MPAAPSIRAPGDRARRPGDGSLGWDVLVTVLLGAALLAGGWMDVRAYLSGRGQTGPAFRFMVAPMGERLGLDEFFHETSTMVHLGNVGRLERDDQPDHRETFRQALGPETTVEVWTALARGRLEFTLRNPVPDQTLTVACNGRTLEEIHLDEGQEVSRRYTVDFQRGSNEFTLTFARYSSHGYAMKGPDKRPIAGRLVAFDLYLPDSDGDL